MMASNHLGLDDVLEDPDLVFETVQSALAVGYLPKQVQERHVASAPPSACWGPGLVKINLSVMNLTGRHCDVSCLQIC